MGKKVFFVAVWAVFFGGVSLPRVKAKSDLPTPKKQAQEHQLRTVSSDESDTTYFSAAKRRPPRYIGASRYAPIPAPAIGTDRFLGTTFSDTQGNASDGSKHIVVDPTGAAHTAWHDTEAGGRPAAARGTYWTCVTAAGGVVNLGGAQIPSPQTAANYVSYRFVAVDATPDGRTLLAGHRSATAGTPAPCAFGTTLNYNGWMGVDLGACLNSWVMSVQSCMDTSLNLVFADDATTADSTLHVTWIDARQSSGPSPLCYSRSTDGGATWSVPSLLTGTGPSANSAGPGRDTLAPGSYFPGTRGGSDRHMAFLSYRLIGSRKSRQLALVYGVAGAPEQPPGTQFSGNIWIRRSTDAGLSWEEAKALTCFDSTSQFTAQNNQYSNMVSAIFDGNDSLHITAVFDEYDPVAQTAAFTGGVLAHINAENPCVIHYITRGDFLNDPSLFGDTFGGSITHPSLATPGILDASKKNVLYAVWTQFSGSDVASQNDTSDFPFYNGEIYAAVSTDKGRSWSSRNLTQTKTPFCSPGTCASEDHAWVADIVANDSLNIYYHLDKYGGQLSGGTTLYPPGNEVHLLRVSVADLPSGNALKGDQNLDGVLDIVDIVTLVNCVVFGGGPNCLFPCLPDFNNDTLFDINDIAALINFVVFGNPPDGFGGCG